jgi:hypothetical protein
MAVSALQGYRILRDVSMVVPMAGHARGELGGTAGWDDGLVLVRCGVR